jgi:hypothetical protein
VFTLTTNYIQSFQQLLTNPVRSFSTMKCQIGMKRLTMSAQSDSQQRSCHSDGWVPDPFSLSAAAAHSYSGMLDIVTSIWEGFENVPRLMGGGVRPHGKVTDFGSGMKEAGKGLFFGIYDGVTGLVTEPMRGGKAEVGNMT